MSARAAEDGVGIGSGIGYGHGIGYGIGYGIGMDGIGCGPIARPASLPATIDRCGPSREPLERQHGRDADHRRLRRRSPGAVVTTFPRTPAQRSICIPSSTT